MQLRSSMVRPGTIAEAAYDQCVVEKRPIGRCMMADVREDQKAKDREAMERTEAEARASVQSTWSAMTTAELTRRSQGSPHTKPQTLNHAP